MESLCETKDDEIQCYVHPRYIWLLMVRPFLALLLILFLLNFAYASPDIWQMMPWPFTADILLLNILLIVIILGPSYLWVCLEYKHFVYIIKKQELVIRKGVIRKRHNSIPYNKILNVQRLQGVLERLFGLCTVSIETAYVSPEFPNFVIPGMLNSTEFSEIILNKTHVGREEGTDLGDTMRQILLQLKDLNKRDQREEDRKK